MWVMLILVNCFFYRVDLLDITIPIDDGLTKGEDSYMLPSCTYMYACTFKNEVIMKLQNVTIHVYIYVTYISYPSIHWCYHFMISISSSNIPISHLGNQEDLEMDALS